MKALKISPENPWLIYLLSAIALLIFACFSIGYLHPDEHFQILELAAWKLDLTTPDKLPWEFDYRMRPAFQPAMVVLICRFFWFFGLHNPFTIAFILRILSAAISFMAMWMIYQCYSKRITNEILRKWFLLLSFLLWFALYNDVRFTSETWSGALFIIGFSYLFIKKRKLLWPDFILTGIFLGLAIAFRFQAGFLVAGFLTWFLFYRNASSLSLFPGGGGQKVRLISKEGLLPPAFMVIGIAAAIITGILIDYWFYGEWTLTSWNYLEQNILEDKISGFGIQPWWFYFTDIFIRAVPPFSLVYILSCLIVFIFLRKDALTWTLLPFVLLHFIIGHKETRFFMPLIGFLPIIIIKAIEFVQDRRNLNLVGNKYIHGFAKLFWYSNILFMFFAFFNPADSQTQLYKKIYEDYPDPVTLYYTSENPYQRAKEINFYKRSTLVIKHAETPGNPESYADSRFLVAIRSKDPSQEYFKDEKLVYSSYPEWMKRFNINKWMDRTKLWYVYEVNR